MGFGDNITTGLKAIVGSIAYNIVMAVLFLVAFIIAGNFIEGLSTIAIFLFILLSLVIGVFILGWIYNLLWDWN